MYLFRRIPIHIHPLFWLLAGMIGWIQSKSFIGILLWIVIVFISVLIHELGHASMAVAFKQNPRIDLVAFGGLTSYNGKTLKLYQQFLVVLNGPIFGFLLFLFATLILKLQLSSNEMFVYFFRVLQIVNLFWSIVNLFPVLPLDGGQLLRIVLEGIFGIKGIRYALFFGMLLAGIVSLFFIYSRQFLIGALFFLFAFQSFDSWKKSRFLSKSDQSDENKQNLIKAEVAMQSGKNEEAKELFAKVRESAKEGLLFVTATQYLAFLYFEQGHFHDAYEMLYPIKKQISEEAICLLHKLAYRESDFSLVMELSSECYQFSPSQDAALRNARAFAKLSRPKLAGGWLQTAYNHGGLDIKKIISEEIFSSVRNDPSFKQFTDNLIKKT